VAGNDTDLMAEFQEFLNAKKEQEKEASASEDFEVEIWDEKGRGVRTRRSHAKPFLNSLGIDVDPDPDDSSDNTDGDSKKDNKSRPRQAKSSSAQGQSITRKYFTKPSGK
jgi:hypothetical protein